MAGSRQARVSQGKAWTALALAAFGVCAGVSAQTDATVAEAPVAIRIDRSVSTGLARLELGVTHTQHDLDSPQASPEAVSRVRRLLPRVCRYQVEPIMGWGADNPEPSPGVYNWESLDRRMALIASMHAIPVITLCAAPDWMKGGVAGKTDWSRIETAPVPEHYADFAALAKKIAERYPAVHFFQVWNEFKGLWDAPNHNWDYVHYTEMYNQVYDALKSVNRETRVGGPYLVVEGTGLNAHEWYGAAPITDRNLRVIDYWLEHKHGADFLVLDRSLTDSSHDPGKHAEAQVLAQTHYFGDIVRQVRARTNLPIWWAEYYGAGGVHDSSFVAAQFASIYLHMTTAQTPQIGFLWGFLQEEGGGYQLFSRIDSPPGGQPSEHYRVMKIFHSDFPPGTPLFHTTSTSPDVEVLASKVRTLLINKRPAPVNVSIDGQAVTLARYEVRLLRVEPLAKLEAAP